MTEQSRLLSPTIPPLQVPNFDDVQHGLRFQHTLEAIYRKFRAPGYDLEEKLRAAILCQPDKSRIHYYCGCLVYNVAFKHDRQCAQGTNRSEIVFLPILQALEVCQRLNSDSKRHYNASNAAYPVGEEGRYPAKHDAYDIKRLFKDTLREWVTKINDGAPVELDMELPEELRRDENLNFDLDPKGKGPVTTPELLPVNIYTLQPANHVRAYFSHGTAVNASGSTGSVDVSLVMDFRTSNVRQLWTVYKSPHFGPSVRDLGGPWCIRSPIDGWFYSTKWHYTRVFGADDDVTTEVACD